VYSILLAAALGGGSSLPSQDVGRELADLKRSVEEMQKEQNQQQIDALKQTINELRQRLIEQRLEALYRAVQELKGGPPMRSPAPLPAPSLLPRTLIQVRLPAGATFYANDREMPVSSTNPVFVTPPLEPGKDYFYDFKVIVRREGKTVIRTKRVAIRPGTEVRLVYEDLKEESD